MASPTSLISTLVLDRLPILFEDDEEGEMGESNPHVLTDEVLHICLSVHFASRPEYQVFANMNLYYHYPESRDKRPLPYVSPDIMAVKPFAPLPIDLVSYEIDEEGPVPEAVIEILSARSAQQRDLDDKVILYAALGVAEYILVDLSGKFLPERLLLKRLQADGTWLDMQDADGGVTSQLGFRLVIDADGRICVLDAATGIPYANPHEAVARVQAATEAQRRAEERSQAEAEARRQAEERSRIMEAELERLRSAQPRPD